MSSYCLRKARYRQLEKKKVERLKKLLYHFARMAVPKFVAKVACGASLAS
jgi:hypothetical protein